MFVEDFYTAFAIAFGTTCGLVFMWLLIGDWRVRQAVQIRAANAEKRTGRATLKLLAAQAKIEAARQERKLQQRFERAEHETQQRRARDLVEIKSTETSRGNYHITLDAPGYHAETMCGFAHDVEAGIRFLNNEYKAHVERTRR